MSSRASGREERRPQTSVAVVGGGVAGLTTAVALADAGYRVVVFTGRSHGQTTSSVAAAFWYPFAVNGYVRSWAASTYDALMTLHARGGRTGIHVQKSVEYLDTESDKATREYIDGLWWRELPGIEFEYQGGEDDPLVGTALDFGPTDTLGCVHFAGAIRFKTLVIHMGRYLDYLVARLNDHGVGVVPNYWVEKLTHLLDREGFDAVVNCAGYASESYRWQRSWHGLHPVQGQVTSVKAPDVKELVFVHTGRFDREPLYVVPRAPRRRDKRPTDVILGGSLDPLNSYPTKAVLPAPDLALEQLIMQRCQKIVSALVDLGPQDIIGSRVGLRPTAGEVQVGHAIRTWRPIFNNYGHGGGGVSLSWGCAYSIVEKITDWFDGRRR